MTTGFISTAIIAAVIGFVFILGMRKIVRKFTKGESDCCSTGGGCGGCGGQCGGKVKS
jgi:hypothetical protein